MNFFVMQCLHAPLYYKIRHEMLPSLDPFLMHTDPLMNPDQHLQKSYSGQIVGSVSDRLKKLSVVLCQSSGKWASYGVCWTHQHK